MREIKFRAWDGENMINDVLPFEWDAVIRKGFHECLAGSNGAVRPFHDAEFRVNVSIIDNVKVEQYTGLKDINGKEIYDGDIMRHPDFDFVASLKVEIRSVGTYLSGWDCVRTDITKGEVIGNIHENKDLL